VRGEPEEVGAEPADAQAERRNGPAQSPPLPERARAERGGDERDLLPGAHRDDEEGEEGAVAHPPVEEVGPREKEGGEVDRMDVEQGDIAQRGIEEVEQEEEERHGAAADLPLRDEVDRPSRQRQEEGLKAQEHERGLPECVEGGEEEEEQVRVEAEDVAAVQRGVAQVAAQVVPGDLVRGRRVEVVVAERQVFLDAEGDEGGDVEAEQRYRDRVVFFQGDRSGPANRGKGSTGRGGGQGAPGGL